MSSIAAKRPPFPWAPLGLAILAFGIAGYAIAFYLTGHPLASGFVEGKRQLQHFEPTPLWTAALVVHAAGGALALVAGAVQWVMARSRLRGSNPRRFRSAHVTLGILYVVAIAAAAVAGGVLAVQAMGGLLAVLGFGLLDAVWIGTTGMAFLWGNRVRTNRDPVQADRWRGLHQTWMVRSFALTSAAITLRLWLPLFGAVGIDFLSGYIVISWLCWVPNLVVAEILVRWNQRRPPVRV